MLSVKILHKKKWVDGWLSTFFLTACALKILLLTNGLKYCFSYAQLV